MSAVHRICLTGAESTGKTTMCELLAARHHTEWVHEYGRDHTVDKLRAGTNDHWTTEDFVVIAKRQIELENAAAMRADQFLFCDTDALATALWHERYQGSASPEVDAIADEHHYALYVLCDIDVPYEHDGVRFDPLARPRMHARFVEELNRRPEPWILVSGALTQRLDRIDAELDRRFGEGF
jgi:HTH-type transcriptional regulator, transcriptional repressor of NAD biosynthesis genes